MTTTNAKSQARATKISATLKIPTTALLGLVFAVLAWRQYLFTDRYAVNLIYWDQWDFYRPFFNEGGLWEIFSIQHGPHRQGLGLLITRGLAALSAWNVRWDAFAVGFTLLAAGLLALRLATRCGMQAGLCLLGIPLFFLNIRQYEGFVGSSNLSHGAIPVLLLMLCSLMMFWKSTAARISALSVLNFVMVFTGFAIFAGFLLPFLFLIEGAHALRAKEQSKTLWLLVALLSCAATWLLFFHGYAPAGNLDVLDIRLEKVPGYFSFMALMFANFFGLPGHGAGVLGVGLLIVAILLFIFVYHGWKLVRHGTENNRVSLVLCFLAGFVLVYTGNTALGRVAYGYETAAAASRYVTLLAPGALVLLLQIGQLSSRRSGLIMALLLAAFTAAGTSQLRPDDMRSVSWYNEGRLAWRASYLKTLDEAETNHATNFQVYPNEKQIRERLEYLQQHQLNLFAPEHP